MNLSARRVLFLSLLVSSLNLSFSAAAKDLSGRIGVGVSNISPGLSEPPSVSVDWQATSSSSFEFGLGTDTRSSQSFLTLGVRYNRSLFIEENQSYFLYMGGGLISQTTSGVNNSGFGAEAGGGSRFFFAGLPNLGFSVLGGLKLETSGGSRFRTSVMAGAHYYF